MELSRRHLSVTVCHSVTIKREGTRKGGSGLKWLTLPEDLKWNSWL